MDDEMAATMGFSSFGTNTKKRKFDTTNSPKPQPDVSGANTTKLGVRRKTTPEGESASPDANTKPDASPSPVEPAKATTTAPSEEPHQPASAPDTKTNAKSKKKGKQPAASGLADFLARGRTLPEKPPAASATPDPSRESAADKEVTQVKANPDTSDIVTFGGTPISRSELRALRKGVRDENGVRTIFKPSFVVDDPWAKLKGMV